MNFLEEGVQEGGSREVREKPGASAKESEYTSKEGGNGESNHSQESKS